MIGATSRGLSIAAFDHVNPGQILDFCTAYNNQLEGDDAALEREASQEDFDRF